MSSHKTIMHHIGELLFVLQLVFIRPVKKNISSENAKKNAMRAAAFYFYFFYFCIP